MSETEQTKCKLPPTGWRCTRGAGHEGPCAAEPVDDIKFTEITGPDGSYALQASFEVRETLAYTGNMEAFVVGSGRPRREVMEMFLRRWKERALKQLGLSERKSADDQF